VLIDLTRMTGDQLKLIPSRPIAVRSGRFPPKPMKPATSKASLGDARAGANFTKRSIDRLGRSTAAVASALAELHAAGVAIYADKEAVDATTPHGRAISESRRRRPAKRLRC
jgi:hypothetical protein